jgi:aminoglycoside phosphotransferase (APT) family kinase protein
MNPISTEGQTLLLELLHHVFGGRLTLSGYNTIKQHQGYTVLLAHLRRPILEVVIKLAGPDASLACPFEQTAWVHELLRRQTSVPVAEIIAADTSYARWPWRYMIKEYIPGVEWATLQPDLNYKEAIDIYTQLAEAVAHIHSVWFSQFGDLPFTGVIHPDIEFVQALKERASGRIRNKRLMALFAQILDERAALFTDVGKACLSHEDLHKFNIIFQQKNKRWQLANILDFDSAWAGCNESDLARLELWNGKMGATFMRRYGAIHPVAKAYKARRPVYQLLWCLEYASETPKHLADTRRVCDELGVPPIKSFVEET